MPRTRSKPRSRYARAKKGRKPRQPGPEASSNQAVVYARVSSRDQEKEGFSIPAQERLLRDYAERSGLVILETFVDVETAKRVGRTNFVAMLKFLKRNKDCTTILVEKTDRLYRNIRDWVTLDEMKVDIHLVKEGVVLSDDSRSTDKFMHGIRVLMAKNYIDNLSEEVSKGMRQKAEEGHWPNPAPVGYLNHRVDGRSTITPDRDKAPLIGELFTRYDTGRFSVADLSEWCAKVGLTGKHGKPLHPSLIHSILRNPLYAGEFVWAGKVYRSKDPTLIRMALFERVQARLDGHAYTRASNHDFPFTGLITCGHCGLAVTAEIQKQKYIYYHCAKRCQREKFIRQEKLVEMFGEVIRAMAMPPEVTEIAVAALKRSRGDVRADTEERLAAARERYDRASRLIDAAYEDKLEGRVDEALFHRKRAEWEEQRSEAQREIERLTRADRGNLDLGLMVLELANSWYSLFISRDHHEQRRMLDLVLSNCTLADGVLMPTYRKPFNFLVKMASRSSERLARTPDSRGEHPEWWAIQDLNL